MLFICGESIPNNNLAILWEEEWKSLNMYIEFILKTCEEETMCRLSEDQSAQRTLAWWPFRRRLGLIVSCPMPSKRWETVDTNKNKINYSMFTNISKFSYKPRRWVSASLHLAALLAFPFLWVNCHNFHRWLRWPLHTAE